MSMSMSNYDRILRESLINMSVKARAENYKRRLMNMPVQDLKKLPSIRQKDVDKVINQLEQEARKIINAHKNRILSFEQLEYLALLELKLGLATKEPAIKYYINEIEKINDLRAGIIDPGNFINLLIEAWQLARKLWFVKHLNITLGFDRQSIIANVIDRKMKLTNFITNARSIYANVVKLEEIFMSHGIFLDNKYKFDQPNKAHAMYKNLYVKMEYILLILYVLQKISKRGAQTF